MNYIILGKKVVFVLYNLYYWQVALNQAKFFIYQSYVEAPPVACITVPCTDLKLVLLDIWLMCLHCQRCCNKNMEACF